MTTDSDSGMGAGPASRPPVDEISIWEVLAVLVRRRGTIVVTTVVVTALAVAATLMRSDKFTTTAVFRPQGSEASSPDLLALASQFGVNIGSMGSEEVSPAFYAELLQSREIRSRVARQTFDVAGVGPTSLADLLEIEEDTEALRQEEVIEWLLDQAISVATARETGTLTLAVRTKWPDLSLAIGTMLLDELARFNLHTRQSQAAAERGFIESRVDSAEHELLAAEEALQTFLEANRQWSASPLLVLQHDRLQREVGLRSSVLTTLLQSYEQARISEVRDTPVITVLQAPFMPAGPDERNLLVAVALGLMLGGLGGIMLGFVREAASRPALGDGGREQFRESWDAFVRSVPFLGRGRA